MALDVIYDYMKTQNRPYSVNDIVTNLNNEHSKAVVQKAVDQLVIDGKLFEKVNGKQRIYCVVQDSKQDIDELTRIEKDLQTHVNEIEKKYQEFLKEFKENEVLLSSLKSTPTQQDLERDSVTLPLDIKNLIQKLDSLMETTDSEDLQESKRKAQKEVDENSCEYIKKKRMCTEIIDCILENYPDTKDKFYEEVGINADNMI